VIIAVCIVPPARISGIVPREIMSALASRQLGEKVRQGDVRPEPFDQAVATVAPGSAAVRAFDACTASSGN
jgi:hypothetical protein